MELPQWMYTRITLNDLSDWSAELPGPLLIVLVILLVMGVVMLFLLFQSSETVDTSSHYVAPNYTSDNFKFNNTGVNGSNNTTGNTTKVEVNTIDLFSLLPWAVAVWIGLSIITGSGPFKRRRYGDF